MFNPLHSVVHYVKKCHGRVDEDVHVDSTLNIFIPLSSSCNFSILTLLMKSHSLPHSGFWKKWRWISSVTSKTSKKTFAILYPPIPFHFNSHEFKQASKETNHISWSSHSHENWTHSVKCSKGVWKLDTKIALSVMDNSPFSAETERQENKEQHLIHFSAWTNSFTVLVSRNRKNGRKEKWMLLFVYHSSKWCHADDQHRVAIKIQEKTELRGRKTRKKEKSRSLTLAKKIFCLLSTKRGSWYIFCLLESSS